LTNIYTIKRFGFANNLLKLYKFRINHVGPQIVYPKTHIYLLIEYSVWVSKFRLLPGGGRGEWSNTTNVGGQVRQYKSIKHTVYNLYNIMLSQLCTYIIISFLSTTYYASRITLTRVLYITSYRCTYVNSHRRVF